MREIVLGGGCFWGVQEFMSRLKGVKKTEVGYANGRGENPTYEDICYTNTYYAEVCKILYDENEISLENILEEFWSIIDPTILNRQGNDIGSQYRTGIYYTDKNDIEIIETKLHGIKALRECSDVVMKDCDIISPEFGWSAKNVAM